MDTFKVYLRAKKGIRYSEFCTIRFTETKTDGFEQN